MTTIKIEVSDKVLDKLLWLLNQFKKDEVHVIHDADVIETEKKKAHSDLQKLMQGKTNLYSLEDIEKDLDDITSKYEA